MTRVGKATENLIETHLMLYMPLHVKKISAMRHIYEKQEGYSSLE